MSTCNHARARQKHMYLRHTSTQHTDFSPVFFLALAARRTIFVQKYSLLKFANPNIFILSSIQITTFYTAQMFYFVKISLINIYFATVLVQAHFLHNNIRISCRSCSRTLGPLQFEILDGSPACKTEKKQQTFSYMQPCQVSRLHGGVLPLSLHRERGEDETAGIKQRNRDLHSFAKF